MLRSQSVDDQVLCLVSVGHAIIKIPGLRLETPLAVMCTTGNEEGDPYTLSVSYVIILDITIIHILFLVVFQLRIWHEILTLHISSTDEELFL